VNEGHAHRERTKADCGRKIRLPISRASTGREAAWPVACAKNCQKIRPDRK